MNNRALLGLGLAVAIGTFSVPAYSQAAAESVLGMSRAASTTIHAGSVLNKATNRMTEHIQQKISSPLPAARVVPKSNVNASAGTAAVTSNSGQSNAGLSVRGAQATCTPAQAGDDKNAAAPPNTNCEGLATPKVKYKSYVTLSFPK